MAKARRTQLVSMVILATAICASAEVRKEFRFTVGPRSVISITNQYGPISVKPGVGTQVIVTAVLHSDQVLATATRARQRPAWAFPGRWLPMADIAGQSSIRATDPVANRRAWHCSSSRS